jgi:hypothetical protein
VPESNKERGSWLLLAWYFVKLYCGVRHVAAITHTPTGWAYCIGLFLLDYRLEFCVQNSTFGSTANACRARGRKSCGFASGGARSQNRIAVLLLEFAQSGNYSPPESPVFAGQKMRPNVVSQL